MRLSKIESGLPIPPKATVAGITNPWHLLKPGDSFIPRDRHGNKMRVKRPSNYGSLYSAAKSHGYRISCREVDGYVRVWRLEDVKKAKR